MKFVYYFNKICILLQKGYNTMKTNKKRFVLLVDLDTYEDFKKLAEEQNRTAGNLGVTLIKNYVKEHKNQDKNN